MLEKLSFRWDAREEKWLEHFDKLRAVVAKHGHCDIDFEADKDLAGWIRVQRLLQTQGKLQDHRKALLEGLNLKWTADLVEK